MVAVQGHTIDFHTIDLDPNTFLSLITTRGPGPKGQGWNMTYAVDVVVVVQGYTLIRMQSNIASSYLFLHPCVYVKFQGCRPQVGVGPTRTW